jgi:hydroxypyruvate isomerase
VDKFSLCIEPVLENYDFYDRIKAAKGLGFAAIEFWDTENRDVSKIGRIAANNGIDISICCLKKAWTNRLNASATNVLGNVVESIKLAKEMGCRSLIGLSGDIDPKDMSQKKTLIDNLRRAADILVKEDITLNLEALNSLVDHKGYYLDSSYLGFDIIKNIDCPNIKLLYDVYHMQIMEGNIIENIKKNIDLIGHFHSAGVPGRNEHFNGENDYHNILKAIDETNYDRYFGLEYWCTYDDEKSISDVMNYLKK